MTRTLTTFIDETDTDLVWRKRELTTLKLSIENKSQSGAKDHHYRAAICLLYAHWEGYIKKCADDFLEFVENQGYDLQNLTPQFRSIVLFGALKSCASSNKLSMYNSRLMTVVDSSSTKFKVGPFKFEVEGNLNYERLHEILSALNYTENKFELNRVIIDTKLLSYRNLVAHGEKVSITQDQYNELHDKIIYLLNEFRNFIQNCAVEKKYLISNI